ncbi:amidase [Azonexus sp.]|uniref:amidase n=1 Tax=Azonexus sp. TaxID=1872668 RepID=UPI0035D3F084
MSATELVESSLARIKQHNPAINAIVTLDEQGALESARRADALRELGHENLPPLHGIPISVKDAFETAGLKTTSSHPPLANYIPARDATVVARLKAAGAIVLGKTNLPELAGDPQCWSPLFGATHNPWNTALTPGGSSGGSAAAVAAGFSFLDPGSDIAGSIRIPAAYCGVAGLKATENRIPRTGHIPHLPTGGRSVRHLLSFGLLARCIDDLQLGLQLLAGPDGIDSEVPPLPIIMPAVIEQPLRIAWWDDFGGLPLCQRTRDALARTVEGLRQQGMTVERRSPPQFDFEKAWHAYGIIAGTEIGLGLPAMQRHMFSLFGHLVPASEPVTRAFLRGFSFSSRRYNEALNLREHLTEQLEVFLDDWDAWVCPVASVVAYPHCRLGGFRKPPKLKVDQRFLSYMEATIGWTTPFSLTGSPVVVLPTGIEDGLPVGLQWIGKRWCDESLLAVCAQVEAVAGGYVNPLP